MHSIIMRMEQNSSISMKQKKIKMSAVEYIRTCQIRKHSLVYLTQIDVHGSNSICSLYYLAM